MCSYLRARSTTRASSKPRIGPHQRSARYCQERLRFATASRAAASTPRERRNPARRIPIVLRLGRTEQRAWLNLRDCTVEKDPSLPNVPVISVEGLDVRPVAGQDPPEIQIRNARIRY